jgi:hypothetical protein
MNRDEVLHLLAALLLGTIPVATIAWKIFGVVAGLRTQIMSLENRLAAQESEHRHLNEKQDTQVEVLKSHYNTMAIKTREAIRDHEKRLKSVEQFLVKHLSFIPRE